MINKAALAFFIFAILGSAVALAQNSAPPMQKACNFQLGQTIFAKWKTVQADGILGCPVNSEGEATYSPQGTSGGRWAQFAPGTVGATDGYIIFADSGP